MPADAAVRRLRAPLLEWYARHRRDLPWRRTRDPYAIWVSEVMLQQTQVATVLPYYRRFLERFPDAASLAAATEDEVLGQWSGLGYYRRARALHRGARTLVERHGGRLPAEPQQLRALPGIGRYTAGAIASIGFGLAEPVLDGNVRRVLSRLFALGDPGAARPASDGELWKLAATLVEGPAPGELNQALMELGALVCTPRNPQCLLCPLREPCRARRSGRPEAYPVTRPARPTEKLRVGVLWIARAGRVLLERPGAGNPLRGTWDFPAREIGGGPEAAPGRSLGALARRLRLRLRRGELLGTASHGILHRRLRLEIYDCRLAGGRVAGRDDLRWIDPRRIDGLPVSGATRKVLRVVEET